MLNPDRISELCPHLTDKEREEIYLRQRILTQHGDTLDYVLNLIEASQVAMDGHSHSLDYLDQAIYVIKNHWGDS